MKKFRFRSFLAGVLVTLMAVFVVIPAVAAYAKKTIDIYTGVNIYVDDKLIQPKDEQGNPVEPFIYDGTTYLPIRAISTALGKPIAWEGKTQSVYVGKHESTEPAVMLVDLDYYSGTSLVRTAASDQDNMGDTHYNCIVDYLWERSYQLNGQYTKLTGTLYQRYENRSRDVAKGTHFEIYGDGKLLFSESFSQATTGYHAKLIDVDLTGVMELRIVSRPGWFNEGLAFGDCGLYT